MTRYRLALVAFYAALLPVTGATQETGTIIPRAVAQMEGKGPNAARLTLLRYAQCAVLRSRGRTARLISLPVDQPEYKRLSNALVEGEDDGCLSGGELSFGGASFRGAIFEAVYQRDFGRSGPVVFDPALETGYAALYAQPYSAEARSAIARYGECIARRAGGDVRALVVSLPGSANEMQSFSALGPKLSGCLIKGERITFSKVVLRGALAEALYRLSKASAPGK